MRACAGVIRKLLWCALIGACAINASNTVVNPLVTNGFSHSYQLDEPTFILGAPGVFFFSFLMHFSMKLKIANRIAPDGRRVLRRHIWCYSVCLYPIKRT